jgi:hypothetical protein
VIRDGRPRRKKIFFKIYLYMVDSCRCVAIEAVYETIARLVASLAASPSAKEERKAARKRRAGGR